MEQNYVFTIFVSKKDMEVIKFMNISVRIEIFKDGDVYSALSPELNVSSYGDTIEEARESLKEAVDAFIEECRNMGTLEDVLEESGFHKINESWKLKKPVIEENYTFAVK